MSRYLPSAGSCAATAGLVGGFLAGRVTGRRDLAGALFAAAGAAAVALWLRDAGPVAAAGLGGGYAAAMGVSHPLAKKIGPWPSVLAVTALSAGASELVGRRRASG